MPEGAGGDPSPQPLQHCPLCGAPNDCMPARSGSFSQSCWCRDVAIAAATLARVPAEFLNEACLCRRCATALPGPTAA